MSAHILVPALDPDRPATLSPPILTGLLREELGYDGPDRHRRHGDAGHRRRPTASSAAASSPSPPAPTRSASAAAWPTTRPYCGCATRWSTAVRDGELPEERLADAAARVRALADWTRRRRGAARPGARRRSGTARRPDIGLVAARRAVRRHRRAVHARSPSRRTSPPSPRSRTSPSATRPRGASPPNWPALLPGTETGTYAGDEAPRPGGSVLAAAADRSASSPSSATTTATPGWRRPWTPCSRPAPTRSSSRWASPRPQPRGALHIATHGAARVCGRAAAEVIAGV